MAISGELRQAAASFGAASDQLEACASELKRTMSEVQDSWDSPSARKYQQRMETLWQQICETDRQLLQLKEQVNRAASQAEAEEAALLTYNHAF